MRDVLAHVRVGEGAGGLGIWWEVSHRLRTDHGFRAGWATRTRAVTEAIECQLAQQREAGRVRSDLPVAGLAQYLQLLCEGLVSRLADAPAIEELHAVLDFVEDSLR